LKKSIKVSYTSIGKSFLGDLSRINGPVCPPLNSRESKT
jgi:hypothetical protein